MRGMADDIIEAKFNDHGKVRIFSYHGGQGLLDAWLAAPSKGHFARGLEPIGDPN